MIIGTTKPDKLDRYLADVFICQSNGVAGLTEPGPGSATPATTHRELFLNNSLISARHAIHYDGGAKEE